MLETPHRPCAARQQQQGDGEVTGADGARELPVGIHSHASAVSQQPAVARLSPQALEGYWRGGVSGVHICRGPRARADLQVGGPRKGFHYCRGGKAVSNSRILPAPGLERVSCQDLQGLQVGAALAFSSHSRSVMSSLLPARVWAAFRGTQRLCEDSCLALQPIGHIFRHDCKLFSWHAKTASISQRVGGVYSAKLLAS